MAALLKDGRARVTGLYSEKSGKTYDATVVLEDTGQYVNFKLDFDRQKGGRKMKLSLYEQETIILYNQAETTAEVYTMIRNCWESCGGWRRSTRTRS